MDYFNTRLGRVQTDAELRLRGVVIQPDVLTALGLFPVEYPEPLYDSTYYTLEPSGRPHPKIDDPQVYVQDFLVVARELSIAKAAAKKRITARRWEVETGGVTVEGFGRILTGIDDQNRVASALQGTASAGIAEVDFKGADGWIKLSREMLTNVAGIIAKHVQACFSRERTLHEAVDAAVDMAALAAIDINAGWPGKEVNA